MEVLTKKLTYQEFRLMDFGDDDSGWYELINGELVQKQSPSLRHQRISINIEFALRVYANTTNSGEVLHAPLDVVLDDNNAYHPDVFFVKKERSFILENTEEIVMGAPDLVVEILSKSTGIYDKGEKKDIYERYGVREYWLVDPRTSTIELYAYTEQHYKLVALLEANEVLKSVALEGFELDLTEVFKA
ncbi:MAG: Uma2 family endonuclease [Saprospiraceae bacterium]